MSKKEKNKDKSTNLLVSILLVLVAVTIYNVNILLSGSYENYIVGLIIVIGISSSFLSLISAVALRTKA